jgi:hypothetical protein
MTARVEKWAVANNEICFYLLKAGLMAFSHLRSKRHFMTAQVLKKAVALIEISSALLPVKIWY